MKSTGKQSQNPDNLSNLEKEVLPKLEWHKQVSLKKFCGLLVIYIISSLALCDSFTSQQKKTMPPSPKTIIIIIFFNGSWDIQPY